MSIARIHAVILSLVLAGSVYAMDDPKPKPEPDKPKDAALEQARAAIAKQDWPGAQGVLREAVARNPERRLPQLYATRCARARAYHDGGLHTTALRIDRSTWRARVHRRGYLSATCQAKSTSALASSVVGCAEFTNSRRSRTHEQQQAKSRAERGAGRPPTQ